MNFWRLLRLQGLNRARRALIMDTYTDIDFRG